MRPALAGALVQIGAAALAGGVAMMFGLGVVGWLAIQVGCALALCAALRQPSWWFYIHALFMPLVISARWLEIPPWWYLACFLLAYVVFGRVDRSRVPLYLSNQAALAALRGLIPEKGSVLDLGAGTGTVVSYLARCDGFRVDGVEHALVPWLIARLRIRLGRLDARVVRDDLMAWPLAGYDVVYAFLSPAAMPMLWQKARREMQSGAVLVSNSFEIPGVPADTVVEFGTGIAGKLFVWRMP